jgi:hypothetical protein
MVLLWVDAWSRQFQAESCNCILLYSAFVGVLVFVAEAQRGPNVGDARFASSSPQSRQTLTLNSQSHRHSLLRPSPHTFPLLVLAQPWLHFILSALQQPRHINLVSLLSSPRLALLTVRNAGEYSQRRTHGAEELGQLCESIKRLLR